MAKYSLLALADFLDSLCRAINAFDLDNATLHCLYNELRRAVPRHNGDCYSILEGTDIIPAFILNNWVYLDSIEENQKNFSELSCLIKATYTNPSGIQISKEKVTELVALSDKKFSVSDKLLCHTPINILLVENTCHYANAVYSVHAKPDAVIKDLIVLTYVVDGRVAPEFAFLHEIGHMVHTRVTQKSFVAPRSFDILHSIITKYISSEPASLPREKRRKLFAEWFAECFAIAVLFKTPYSHLDRHIEISNEDKSAIEKYMSALMDTLDKNKLGNRTWEQIEKLAQIKAE